MFTYHTSLRLRDSDAAGVIYYPNLFNIAQEALEAFMESVGMDIGVILRATHFHLPVVHAEADFHQALFPGQKLRVTIQLGRAGTTSFTLDYQILDRKEDVVKATARVIHVVVDRKTGAKKALPPELLHALEQL